MDIYEFINSRDIRKYLKEINYSLSPLECVYIVWQNTNNTIEEKHKAYRWIVKKMPDEIKLSDFISEYIAIENELIDNFNDNRNSVYSYETGNRKNGAFYPDKEMCISAMRQNRKIGNATVIKHLIATESSETGKNIKAIINENGECIFMYEESVLSGKKKKIFDSFKKMHFDIPLPFDEGALIIERYGGAECRFYYRPSKILYNKKDMSAWYFDRKDSESVIVDNYLNLEYYYDYSRMENLDDDDLPF